MLRILDRLMRSILSMTRHSEGIVSVGHSVSQSVNGMLCILKQGYIFWPFPPPWGGISGKDLKEDLKKGREKGGGKKKGKE